ncbi:MAG: ABC-type transport auxiliary lipoprotein family protein, partial [Beijerinckiaceae bacterium]
CAAGLLAFAVAACGGGAAPPTFDLTAPTGPARRSGGGQIVVTDPVALAIYDGDRIVVRQGGQVSVLKNAQWADRLPRLIQARLVQAFENVGRKAGVGRPGDRLDPDNLMNIDIRAFEIDADRSVASVSITAKLVSEGGRVSRAKVFNAQEAVGAVEGAAAAQALDAALSRVLVDIVRWTGGR